MSDGFCGLTTNFDDLAEVKLTWRFISALIELMTAEVEMMQLNDDPESWHWGRCYVGDLAEMRGLSFAFGGKDDMPDDDLGQFGVIVVPDYKKRVSDGTD